jgi:hypothetical protein
VTCLPVVDDDEIFTDEVEAADVAVKIDTHAGPIQPRCDLLDMGRFGRHIEVAVDTEHLPHRHLHVGHLTHFSIHLDIRFTCLSFTRLCGQRDLRRRRSPTPFTLTGTAADRRP